MKKEIEKSEWEKEVVYNTVYLPVRFFKKDAYIRIDDYKEVRDKREKVVEGLEEENKELKEWKENLIRADKKKSDHIDELEEENKMLHEEQGKLHRLWSKDTKHIQELEEENKKLKKERDLYKARNEELNENCFGLSKENEKLKSDLSECECSFGFENDEVGFWKREYKRLKKWIKDHCKGYGNLFPEDEMKRQWKKADKKRK